MLDVYVDAVVAREPRRLPLAATVKFTENGQRLPVGDGLWHTLPDGRKVETGPKIPWTWAIAEVFKIERGPVESVLHAAPYGLSSGWSTCEQSLSSEPHG